VFKFSAVASMVNISPIFVLVKAVTDGVLQTNKKLDFLKSKKLNSAN